MKTSSLIILVLFTAFIFQLGIKAVISADMANAGLEQCSENGKIVWRHQCEPTVKKIFGA